MKHASNFQPGDVIDGRLFLNAFLRDRAFDETWLATDTAREEPSEVWVRLPVPDVLLHDEIAAAFEAEHEIGRAFDHPNIEATTSFGCDAGRGIPYVTMSAAMGETLEEFLRIQPFEGAPLDQAFDIAFQLLAGLRHVHERGYVHGDLTPGNVLVQSDGTVKMMNFTLARRAPDSAASSSSTVSQQGVVFEPGGLRVLSPGGASVEVFDGEAPTPSDDIYSLGEILYQVFGATRCYETHSSPRAEALGLVPPDIPRLSRRQNRALREAVEFRRERRTPHVDRLVEGLQAG